MEKTKVVENLKSISKVVKPHMVGRPSKSKQRYEDKKKPYSRPHSFISEGSNPQLPPIVKCFRCGRPHIIIFCLHLTPNVICGKCHKYGYVMKDYRTEAPNASGG